MWSDRESTICALTGTVLVSVIIKRYSCMVYKSQDCWCDCDKGAFLSLPGPRITCHHSSQDFCLCSAPHSSSLMGAEEAGWLARPLGSNLEALHNPLTTWQAASFFHLPCCHLITLPPGNFRRRRGAGVEKKKKKIIAWRQCLRSPNGAVHNRRTYVVQWMANIRHTHTYTHTAQRSLDSEMQHSGNRWLIHWGRIKFSQWGEGGVASADISYWSIWSTGKRQREFQLECKKWKSVKKGVEHNKR